METRKFLISGRVQGVGFRAFVRARALSLGLRGYAKNLADGRVEVLATGSGPALSDLAGLLRTGPTGSEVRSVEETEGAPSGYDGFLIQ